MLSLLMNKGTFPRSGSWTFSKWISGRSLYQSTILTNPLIALLEAGEPSTAKRNLSIMFYPFVMYFVVIRYLEGLIRVIHQIDDRPLLSPRPHSLPFANDHYRQRATNRGEPMQKSRLAIHPILAHGIGEEHAASYPAEQGGAYYDGNRETIHEFHHKFASPDDDRHAHQQAENHEIDAVPCCTGNSNHIVETHHRIRDDNGLYCTEKGRAGIHRVLVTFGLGPK